MNSPTVLVVENNPRDTLLVALAFSERPLRFETKYVYDEHEALEYLTGKAQFANRELYPFPDCVVIDLHMPRLAGLALLYWIRKQVWLTNMPVILLSTNARSDAVHNMDNTFVIPASDTEAVFRQLEFITTDARRSIPLNSLGVFSHN